jgi:hypothetical protein
LIKLGFVVGLITNAIAKIVFTPFAFRVTVASVLARVIMTTNSTVATHVTYVFVLLVFYYVIDCFNMYTATPYTPTGCLWWRFCLTTYHAITVYVFFIFTVTIDVCLIATMAIPFVTFARYHTWFDTVAMYVGTFVSQPTT